MSGFVNPSNQENTKAWSSRTKSAQTTSGLSGALDISVTKFLREHVLFKEIQDEKFIEKLASSLQIRMYADRDSVIKKGEVGRAMFFILKGQIEVVSEDGETTSKVLLESEFFGEIGVLFSVPRTVSCRARGRCLLLILTKDALAKASQEYPKVAESIALIAQERFSSYVKQKNNAVKVDFGEEIKLGITQIPLFRDCEVGFLHMLAISLTPVQYHQGELIIKKGDAASEMYFVVKGTAEVFNEEDGAVYAQFTPGSFFGEVGLFFDIKRTASVHCTSDVMVFKLTREVLDKILENYPEVSQKIKTEAKQRFMYNQEREKIKLTIRRKVQTEHEVIRERLKSIPYFKDGSIGFLHQLALMVKFRDVAASEIIIKKDDPGDSMFIIIDGTAQVVSPDGRTIYAELATNSFFGEVSLFYEVNRTATVKAKKNTTVLEISKASLQSVLEQHVELKTVMMEKAKENYELFLKRQSDLKNLNLQESSNKQGASEEYDIEATVARFKRVSIFEKCQPGFLKSLAMRTSVKRFKKGEIIIKKGDVSAEMFFVVDGHVEIVSEEGQIFDSVPQGGFFGEIGVIKAIQRTATVRAGSAVCNVIVLAADALKRIVKDYPESFQTIALESEKRCRKVEERSGSELLMSTEEIGKMMAPKKSPTQNNDEFTDAIKANKRERMSITKMFKSKDGSKELRQLPTLLDSGEPAANQRFKEMSASQDSIQDPEPKRGMNAAAVVPATRVSATRTSDSDKGSRGTLGKIFSSLRNSMVRRSSSAKVGPAKMLKRDDASIVGSSSYKAVYEHILDLADSDVAIILSKLLPTDKLRMRLVCRKWSELFHQSQMWKTLDLRTMFRSLATEKMFIFSELSGESLTELNLAGCWQILDEDLRNVSVSCPNLAVLSVSNCWKISDKGVMYLAQNCTRMVDLDLSYCGQLTCSGLMDHHWAQLQKANFSFCKQMGDEHLEALLSKTSNVQSLSFRRCTRITDFGLFLVVRYCRRLKYLDLSDCDHISDKCLKWIASSCTHLKHLNLRFCTRITNGGLYDLSLGSQNFSYLKLNHCTQLTDASIIFFSENIRDLNFMYLRRCRKLTDNSANYLIRASPKLQLLDMTGCPNINTNTQKSLQKQSPRTRVRVDLSNQERGIQSPAERGDPVATEISIPKRYTSGPKDVMSGKSHRSTSKSAALGDAPKESSKRKKGLKSTTALMD